MRGIAIMVCATLISGCADLSGVRDISARLSKATSSWNDVGSEIAGSCQREASLNPLLSNCEAEKRSSEGVHAANMVLNAYFKALTNAANETNFTIQPGLDAATKSVAAIPDVKTARVDAVSGLIGFLAQLATSAMRESVLQELIDRGAPNAKSVIDGMDEVLGQPLLVRLDTEKIYLTAIYVKQIRDQKDNFEGEPADLCQGSKAASFSGAGFLLAQDYCRRLGVIKAREQAVTAYQASLKDASAALSKLQSSRTRLKAKDLARRLYQIGSEFDDKINAVDKAFS